MNNFNNIGVTISFLDNNSQDKKNSKQGEKTYYNKQKMQSSSSASLSSSSVDTPKQKIITKSPVREDIASLRLKDSIRNLDHMIMKRSSR